MKKVYCMLGIVICCVLHSVSARADMIWEPDDSFYESHSGECTYVNRQFTANGPEGKVILYKSPELPVETDTWENGYQTYISFTYTDSDGIVWGVYDGKPGGWMPMAYMEVVYDSISFREEHSADLVEQTGELDMRYLRKEIKLWKYPGSEQCAAIEAGDHTPSYQTLYVDRGGHSWGWVGYYYGHKDVWVCIDQPTADFDELYPDGAPEPEEKTEDVPPGNSDAGDEEPGNPAQDQKTERIVPRMDRGVVRAAVIMVALVILATAGLLFAVRKRRR